MTKIRTPGPLSADDRQWLKRFQADEGGKPDGKFGRQTLDLFRAQLAACRQPDDPGQPPRPDPSVPFGKGKPGGAFMIVCGILIVLLLVAVANL